MKINGKDVNVQLDLGTLEILLQEKNIDYIALTRKMYMELNSGKDADEISKSYNNTEITKWMIWAGAKRYAEDHDVEVSITEDDLKRMSISEYLQAEIEMMGMIADFNPEPTAEEPKAKNSKRRK